MPFVIDETCWTCKEPVEFELHPDGSVKAARCRCGGPHYGEGRAYSRGTFALWQFQRCTIRVIEERLKQHRDNLAGWQEPDGYLLPTEPDAEERWRVRDRLMTAIKVLEELKKELFE